ncbi:hypothetical protein KPH14_001144 [Odynerus spinipes]|uniref:Uncharacterized protein n=1 Tax=Odynerus spinipes TaxID=1348599 RepID=A0AAD9RQQ6_9HYME|nr:hypothetical protein KPH14_001144 [Odynerus spinipes]
MVGCLTICNSACIACIWCFLVSICFPKFTSDLDRTDSNEYCTFQDKVKRPGKNSNLTKERSSFDSICFSEHSNDSALLKNPRKLREDRCRRSTRKRRSFEIENIRSSKDELADK